MASVVLRFVDNETFGRYLSQLEDGGLSGNITRWVVEGYDHVIIGDDLPPPTPELFNNNHVYTFFDEADMLSVLNDVSLPSLWEIRNKGGMIVFAGLGGGDVISSEAQDVLDNMPNALTAIERSAIIEFVNSQSVSLGNGNWALMDSFAHFALQDPVNALWDWKRKVGMTNNGAVHQPGIGFEFNGTTAFIDSLYTPSTDIVNGNINNFIWGGFMVTGDIDNSTISAIRSAGIRTELIDSSGEPGYRISSFSTTTPFTNIHFEPNCLAINGREIVGNAITYFNGSSQVSALSNVTEMNAQPFYIGARNTDGSPSTYHTGILSSFIVGAAIGFDHPGYYNDLVQLNNSLG